MTNRPPPRTEPSLEGYHLPPGRRPAPLDHMQPMSSGDLPRVARPQGGGEGGRRPPPTRGSFLGGLLFYLGLAVLAVLVFAGAFLIGSSPDAVVRQRIVDAVKAHTGRDLVIEGGTSVTFYPSLGIVMRNVTLSTPPGMAGAPTARIGVLEASVDALALLKRQIEVERLVVRDGVFDLRIDKSGRRSWQFADAVAPAAGVRYAELKVAGVGNDAARGLPAEARDFLKNSGDEHVRNAGATAADKGLGKLRALSLADVRLENGTITYSDERTGKSQRISAVFATLSARAIDAPLETKGNLVVEGQRIDFDARLTSLKGIVAEQPAKLLFSAVAQPAKVSFDGNVQVRDTVDLSGAFTLAAPSARALGAWAGAVIPPSGGFGPLTAKGNLHAAGKSLAFSDSTFELDGAQAVGTLSLDGGGKRPLIKANLKVSALDLDKYLADGRESAQPAKPSPADAAPKSAGGAPHQARSIEDLLEQAPGAQGPGVKGPAVKAYRRRSGWSEEPIGLGALALADVDASLAVGSMVARDLKIGASRLKVALVDRTLRTTIEDMALYDGRARGLVTVDGTAATAKVTASLAAEGLAANPLLKDAADIDWLSGAVKLQLALAGSGLSERQIVDSLDGTASFNFANGSVAGYNVAQILRGIGQGRLAGFDRVPTEKTDFSELSASFTVTDGIAANQDLSMASPLLRVTGAGRIMLGARQIDYTARPKIVGSLAGQGGGLDLAGVEVPVRIQGSWDAPTFTPDLQGALKSPGVQEIIKDPSKAVEAAKEIGKKLGGKKAGDLLRGLLGD